MPPKKEKTNAREQAANDNKRRRRTNRGSDGLIADYAGIEPGLLQEAICAVCAAHCAIQFGYTRDGGAYVFRIVGDGDEPYNEYVRPTEDVGEYLRGLVEDFGL